MALEQELAATKVKLAEMLKKCTEKDAIIEENNRDFELSHSRIKRELKKRETDLKILKEITYKRYDMWDHYMRKMGETGGIVGKQNQTRDDRGIKFLPLAPLNGEILSKRDCFPHGDEAFLPMCTQEQLESLLLKTKQENDELRRNLLLK